MRVRTTAVFMVALLSACSGSEPRTVSEATVRDSAGVSIVENPALSDGPQLGWSLGEAPSLDIGALDGPAEYQLFRVQDAARLSGGRVAIVNGGSSEVRVYSSEGSFLESWGTAGEGPGEYLQPMTIVTWPPDSLAVWDWQQRRVSVLAQDGTYARSFRVPLPEGMAFPVFSHVMENGRVVVSAQGFPPGPPQGGLNRNAMTVALLSPEGEMVSDLGDYVGDEVYTHVGDGTVEVQLLPFSRRSIVAPAGAEVLISGNGRFEMRYFGADGTLLRIARIDEPRHLVTESDRQAELARSLADAPVERHPRIRSLFETLPMPDTLPAFSRLVLDASGHHWMRIYRAPTDTGPDRWIVLDAQGVLRGSVDVPERLDIYEIGSDYVLGRATDDLDVEHVQMWPLRR